ncbi:MAG: multidrug efflux SMR transporter [Phycisphaerales bacterium]|nr:multidrug efflux SMR transporter [Phycisphaerales bacterium]
MDQLAWIALLGAGCCEVLATTCIKLSDGMRLVRWLVGFVATMCGSLYLLSVAVHEIPIGTAYAVWTGIGAVGTAAAGMWAFGESKAAARIACLLLIIAGVVGLRVSAG